MRGKEVFSFELDEAWLELSEGRKERRPASGDVARAFRVAKRKANAIIAELVGAVRAWRVEAEQAPLSRAEEERMAPAFRLAE